MTGVLRVSKVTPSPARAPGGRPQECGACAPSEPIRSHQLEAQMNSSARKWVSQGTGGVGARASTTPASTGKNIFVHNCHVCDLEGLTQ